MGRFRNRWSIVIISSTRVIVDMPGFVLPRRSVPLPYGKSVSYEQLRALRERRLAPFETIARYAHGSHLIFYGWAKWACGSGHFIVIA